jgi:hypothetical protein
MDCITVRGEACLGTNNISDQIEWQVEGIGGSGTGDPNVGTGEYFGFNPVPPLAPSGRNEPLSYRIIARLSQYNISDERTITQDNLDELRQEYVDFGIGPPPGCEFDTDEPAFPKLLDKPIDVCDKHDWHILNSVNGHAISSWNVYVCVYYGWEINFTSGYRCPVGNSHVSTSSLWSNHQYGKAFDFDQGNDIDWAISDDNYYVFLSAINTNCLDDTYLLGSDGWRHFWNDDPFPAMRQCFWIKGHAGWGWGM